MQPIGSSSTQPADTAGSPRSGRTALWGTVIGLAVLVVIFAVALIQAANANSLLGWILAGIALGWLMLAVWALTMVRRAAAFGREQVRQAQEQFQAQHGRAPATTAGEGRSLRDEKLAHGMQVILVQSTVVKEQLSAPEPDPEQIRRALETIDMTAANGLRSLKDSGTPVSGTVVD
ncbi:hypothetical protein [Kocuria rhizophila]|uniref:Hypothetical membrane protein n=1 Tax=Kocuria rhizophila (strain ATCC 9341 / DSM 348 / NBRC 103217 / DC2201) TaxID=378753 RepID=B2GM29_KOCRD|nr:hypothetical protein [Kocuria rhizophila]ASE12079.1 hypothetical protein CEP81_10860 [Kocuria rhizophila]MBK4120733.1 hypothetical protein [Kocuria rhizophila]MCC5674305.1 hypothetical protein [Kocuria rhizophila]VEH74586.1 Uncharacterised protein [Kocuria rhizophila]BAG30145.1 hypothetical membrane protein [Kocuria rhizophila DC2201]